MKTILKLESEVRGYVRSFPTTFAHAVGAKITDKEGVEYIDFFSGAGALNYGHNHPVMKHNLLEYLAKDGIVHGLDMATEAKELFLKTFDEYILQPREMDYKVQFTGPTGTNTVEAALKLAQLVTGRSHIIAFTNGYHGHTKGSLRVTANNAYREGLSDLNINTTFLPYCGYVDGDFDSADYIEQLIEDSGSGMDKPAAIILETVQGEGGINVASEKWLQRVEQIAKDNDIILIVDDIQAGCGRAGSFFSFESAGIKPDMITLSKSLSGFGQPMSILLFKPELDKWEAGQHTGTFRGNNMAFVTATSAIQLYWKDSKFAEGIAERSKIIFDFLEKKSKEFPELKMNYRGRGLMIGLEFGEPEMAKKVAKKCYKNGMIIETCGSSDHVIKFFAPLNIELDVLDQGLAIFEKSLVEVMEEK